MYRRPPDVICGTAILDLRWRRWKWCHPRLGEVFWTPIEAEAQNGGPSASGRHLGWPHLRNRKWGHPRWRPEAEGPPFCASASMGSKKPPYTTDILLMEYKGNSRSWNSMGYVFQSYILYIFKTWRTFPHMTDQHPEYDEPTQGWGRFVEFTFFYLPAYISMHGCKQFYT